MVARRAPPLVASVLTKPCPSCNAESPDDTASCASLHRHYERRGLLLATPGQRLVSHILDCIVPVVAVCAAICGGAFLRESIAKVLWGPRRPTSAELMVLLAESCFPDTSRASLSKNWTAARNAREDVGVALRLPPQLAP